MAVEKSTMQDMTVGSPVHHILKFFFPLLFGMLFQQFYSLVDTAIVGWSSQICCQQCLAVCDFFCCHDGCGVYFVQSDHDMDGYAGRHH